jgi:hypothetical protein
MPADANVKPDKFFTAREARRRITAGTWAYLVDGLLALHALYASGGGPGVGQFRRRVECLLRQLQ